MNVKWKSVLLGAVGIVYVILGVLAINWVTVWVTDRYHTLLGTKASDLAQMSAVWYTISDEEVKELKTLNFREVLNHPANKRLEKLFTGGNFSDDFKYAYIMVALEPEEVVYEVKETEEEEMGLPAGSPKNLLWLVDVVINDAQHGAANGDPNYYDDEKRYSCMRPEDVSSYGDKEASYIVSMDEYGDAFTGLAPIYSTEGTFVGMMGVDIYYDGFSMYVSNIRLILTFIFLTPSVVLTGAYLVIYLRKVKQSDKSANTDPLTGLFNRRYLDVALKQMIKESAQKGTSLSVIMLDIDHFKAYNDAYGHQKGDEALVAISAAIPSVLRQNTDVVCRYGGEEIILLLPNTDLVGAIMVAEKVKDVIRLLKLPHISSPVDEYVTVSQGIFTSMPSVIDSDLGKEYMLKADKALYRAKSNGRNRYEAYCSDLI